MPFLDDLIGIHDLTVNGGSAVPRRSVLNVIGSGVTAVDNPTTGQTDLTLPTSNGGSTITAAVLSGNVNNYSPTSLATASVIRISSGATPRTITGIDANAQPRTVWINYGSSTITLSHQDVSSAAANRIVCPGSVAYGLAAGACVELVRDGAISVWRVVT